MREGQTPSTWIGQYVVLNTIGEAHVLSQGRLVEVNTDGLVLFEMRYVQWNKEDPSQEERGWGETREGEKRWVYEFYPWRSVFSLRLQEPEEQRDTRRLLKEYGDSATKGEGDTNPDG